MKATEFPGHNIVIAKDQPQYTPLPANIDTLDPQGRLTCCWILTWRERWAVLFRGVLWHQILTFGGPLQPQLLTTKKPI